MRRVLIVVAGLAAIVAVVVVGLGQRKDGGGEDAVKPVPAAEAARMLRGSPPALAALHAQAGRLLAGAPAVTLSGLRGRPTVINKWASWCVPCRQEFPVFSRVSARLGRRVAFVGLNAGDNAGNAQRFLARNPVSYPSLSDPEEHASIRLSIRGAWPITVFFDARGRKYVHAGPYVSEAALSHDVERYALR